MAEKTVDKAKLYATLYNAAYPKKSKQVCQLEFNVKWTELKKGEGLEDKVAALLWEWKSVELKNKGSLLTFWSKQAAVAPLSATLPKVSTVCPSTSSTVSDDVKVASDNPSLITQLQHPYWSKLKFRKPFKE